MNFKKLIAEAYPEAVFLDGFDKAILGVTTDGQVLYSLSRQISILMHRDHMANGEAREFLDFNRVRLSNNEPQIVDDLVCDYAAD